MTDQFFNLPTNETSVKIFPLFEEILIRIKFQDQKN